MIWVYVAIAIVLFASSYILGYCIGARKVTLGPTITDDLSGLTSCNVIDSLVHQVPRSPTYHPLQFPSESPQYPTKSKDDKNS